jgi:hypothetical protein
LSALRGSADVTANLRLPDGTTRDAALAILDPEVRPTRPARSCAANLVPITGCPVDL